MLAHAKSITHANAHANVRRFNASSYENDIALVELQKLPYRDTCFHENPAVRAVCVPWTTQLFQTNHTCSISGWGRTSGTLNRGC